MIGDTRRMIVDNIISDLYDNDVLDICNYGDNEDGWTALADLVGGIILKNLQDYLLIKGGTVIL